MPFVARVDLDLEFVDSLPSNMVKAFLKNYKERCIVTFWKEITYEEYMKMSYYLEEEG